MNSRTSIVGHEVTSPTVLLGVLTVPPPRSLNLFALLITSFTLSACHRVHEPTTSGQPEAVVWPASPEVARIAYVKSVVRPGDFGFRLSTFTRFGNWLAGTEKGNEPLLKPFGLALDENDNLCLTDTGANAVCYYDGAKRKWYRWTRVGRITFSSPVAVAKRGNTLFVVDSALGALVAFDASNGKLLFRATNHLERPSGLTLLNGQLLVADSQRHRIIVFGLDGSFQREFGKRGVGHGEFNFPTHLAADSANNLYVTDSMNSRIQVLDDNGVFKTELGSIGDSPGRFGRPKGVAVDPAGRVYAVDALFDNVQIFSPDGKLLLNWGETGAHPGEFWLANGIVINRKNEIFVADSYNHRIQVFKYIGPS